MSINFELEIKSILLKEDSFDQVIEKVIFTIERQIEGMTNDDVVTLCRFLIQAQAYPAVVQFVFRHWNEKDFIIPWPYFLKALSSRMTVELAGILWEGMSESKGFTQGCRSDVLDSFYPAMAEKRNQRKERLEEILENRRQELLTELATLNDRQLYEREKAVLRQLLRMYPGDTELIRKNTDLRDRSALEIIAKHAPLRRSIIWDSEKNSPEALMAEAAWSQCLLETAASCSEICYELSVAAYMMGLFETSLKILNLEPDPKKYLWFRLEILLQARHYLELLSVIAQAELHFHYDPETFFATTYLRAQAMWGMGQKHTAVELMESLLSARPGYRLGLTFLSQWKDHR